MAKKYTYLVFLALGTLFSCTKNDPEVSQPELPVVFESTTQPLTSLSVAALNDLVGVSREKLIERLNSDKVDYKDNDYEIVYYTQKEGSPFSRYKITFSFSTKIFDFNTKPYELYRGVDDIEIRPINQDNTNVKEGDYKKVFDYFYPRFTNIQPNKKPLSMVVENTDVSPKIEREESNYTDFIKDLSNVDAVVTWNNNPPTTEIDGLFGRKQIVLLSKDSSKEKNTPIITMRYWYERQGWLIRLKFNKPYDWEENSKK